MASIAKITPAGGGRWRIEMNYQDWWEDLFEGLRRAQTCLTYGVHATSQEPLQSIVLDATVPFTAPADPLSPQDATRRQQDFRAWVIGQALLELDQVFNRFLLSALQTITALKEIRTGKRGPSQKTPNINTSVLYLDLFKRSGVNLDGDNFNYGRFLDTLSNARNCLAHDSGIVTEKRLRDGVAAVRWCGQVAFSERDGVKTLLPRVDAPIVKPEDVGKSITIERIDREQVYRLGERIRLEPHDLAEIIWFYFALGQTAHEALDAYFVGTVN